MIQRCAELWWVILTMLLAKLNIMLSVDNLTASKSLSKPIIKLTSKHFPVINETKTLHFYYYFFFSLASSRRCSPLFIIFFFVGLRVALSREENVQFSFVNPIDQCGIRAAVIDVYVKHNMLHARWLCPGAKLHSCRQEVVEKIFSSSESSQMRSTGERQ